MTTYEKNKEKIPNLDDFKDSKNNFLSDIYKKASRYNLSDRQVAAANRAYDNLQASGGKTPWEQNVEQWPEIQDLKDNMSKIDSVQSIKTSEIIHDMVFKASRYKLSEKQIEFLKKLYKESQDFVQIDKEKMKRVLNFLSSCSPRSDFVFDAQAQLSQSEEDVMLRSIYNKIVSMAHKYRRCIFKRVFK